MKDSEQPQILKELRQKSASLKTQQEKLKQQTKSKNKILKSTQTEIQTLHREKEIQQRKYKSLVVLIAQLQRQYDEAYLQSKQLGDDDESQLISENTFLRTLLVKQAETVSDLTSLNQFFKQLDASKNRANDFLNKSRYLQSQVQLLAKLRGKVHEYTNQNLECRRKWAQLQKESTKLQAQLKSLKIQLQRQKVQMKQQYQEYLQKVNDSKSKLVYFNETHNPKVITEHFVEEIALLQERRLSIQQQNKNLQYHHQNLLQELSRIKVENRQLKSFFDRPGEESKLAGKMKTRIEQLKDSLLEEKKKNSSLRLMRLTKILQAVRRQHQKHKEANDYLQLRVKEQKNSVYSLDEKDVVSFFTKVLNGKDQQISLLRQEQNSLQERVREMKIKKTLIQNKIQGLQEGLDLHNAGQNYRQNALQQQILRDNSFTFKKEAPQGHRFNNYLY